MTTVPLSRQYVIGSAVFDALTFRAPKLADYREIGKVAEMQRGVVVVYNDAVWQYADRLLQAVSTGALSELDLTDALAVEGAIIDFFTEATKLLNKRETSSSDSVGAPPT